MGQHTIGRAAWNPPDGPQLLPVIYAYYNKTIVFRTVPDAVMSQLARRTNVAFEIDGVDEQARTGWSVVVRGTAERVMQDYDLVELWTKAGPVPWAAGERTMHIAITHGQLPGVKSPQAEWGSLSGFTSDRQTHCTFFGTRPGITSLPYRRPAPKCRPLPSSHGRDR